jgi:hypothetical protein
MLIARVWHSSVKKIGHFTATMKIQEEWWSYNSGKQVSIMPSTNNQMDPGSKPIMAFFLLM